MDIDIYQQCPCHADKKIKFCCGKGVVGDLNQILAKSSSGQPKSALDQIDRAIKKDGPKDCLLTIQTHILISTGDIEKAKEVNSSFLANNPGHATGLHHKALICLAEGNPINAVEVLQDAMDAIKGNEIPLSLGNAFRVVGVGLLESGNSFAGHAHLKYAASLKGESDPELQQMLFEMFRNPNTSLILKQDFLLAAPVEGVEWGKRYRNVHRALDRGQFRKALQFLERIDSEHPNEPIVVRGLAIVNSFLGRIQELIPAWRRYARLEGISKAESVEAEAIAQVFDSENAPQPLSLVRLTFELSETDAASEAAISCPSLVVSPPLPADPFEEGPAPRSVFVILDRDKLDSAEELSVENAPQVIGEILLYGKQTDRAARLEAVCVEDARGDKVKELIKATFGEELTGETNRTEIGETNVLAEMFDWNWHFPPGVTRKQHDDLVKAHCQAVLMNDWTEVTFPMLGGNTPKAAAKDPEMELPLQAMLMMLENAGQGQFFEGSLTDELRGELGLSKLDAVEYSETKHVSSPILQQYLELKKLSDDALLKVRNDAMQIGNLRLLRRVVPEILRRDEIEVPKDISYSMMAQLSNKDDEAFDYIAKACEAAKADGRSQGVYLVQEFEMRLARGATEELRDLLGRIQRDHLDEPEVEYRLVRVLDRYGIGPEQGPIRGKARQGQPAMPPAAAAEASSPVWTPGDEPAPAEEGAAEPAPEEKSKLWIPD